MIQLPKKFLPLIIAAVLGVIAVFLFNVYVQQQTEEARKKAASGRGGKGGGLMRVVVARTDISAGATISENMVAEQGVSKEALQPRAATSVERVIDKITIAPFSKGEQILLNKLTVSGQETSLSNKIPMGKRAITVSVDVLSAVGGMIKPGDKVDVLGAVPIPTMTAEGKQASQMATMPLFQDVLVLAVGTNFSSAPSSETTSSRASPAITLALSPQEANLIGFVQEHGRIRLVLRSPGDSQIQPAAPASWEMLLRTVLPQYFQERERGEAVPAPAPVKKVEIYHGSKKEVKDLE